MGGVQRHIIEHPAFDVPIGGFDLGIGGAVAGDGMIVGQGLFHRAPGSGPEIAVRLVAQIDIAAGLVELVEGVAQDAAGRAGLDKAVAAGVLGDDGAVLRRAQIVGPGHGRAGIGDHILPFARCQNNRTA